MSFNFQNPAKELLDFALIATSLSNCSAAVITLTDGKIIYVKSNHGKAGFDTSFYYNILLNTTDDVLLKSNLRIADTANVFDFYLGISLKTKDQNSFGVLSLWNETNVEIKESQLTALKALARQIEQKLIPENQLQSLIVTDHIFYESCLKKSKVGLWELNVNTSEFKLNDVAMTILGYGKNDFKDFSFKTFLKIIYKDYVQESISFLSQIKNKEIDAYSHDLRVRHKKGYWSWTTITGQVTKWSANGAPEIVAGTMLDIHDLKTMEFQLNSIIDNISCVAFRHIFFSDGTQEIVHITKGTEKLWGLTTQEVYADFDSVWNLLLEEEKARMKAILDNSIATLEKWEGEWRIQHPDGSIRWHKGQGIPVKNKNGSVSIDTVIIDITDQVAKKEELKVLNKKLNQAQEIAGLGYWEFDLIKGTSYWSDKIYDILGLGKDSILESFESLKTLLFEEDIPLLEGKRKKSIATGEEYILENRVKKPDGSIIWIRQKGHYIKDTLGTPIFYEGTIQDITATKLISLSLEDTLNRYHLVTEATSDAIWDLDFVKSKIYWGENYKKMFGYPTTGNSEDDLAYWESKIHPDDRKRVVQSFDSSVKLGAINWQEDYKFLNSNKEYSDVSDKAFIVRDEKGMALRMVGAMQDVTDSKKAKLELEDTIQRYDLVTKATSDAIWDLDFITGEIFRGENYRKLFGYSSFDMINNSLDYWKSKIHPEDRKRVLESFNLCIESGDDNWYEEYRFGNKDNKYLSIIDKAFIVRNSSGNALRMVGAIQDVTEKLQAIEDIKRANERFEKVAEATNDGIWDWDLKNNVVFHGAGYSELFGYSKSEENSNPEIWIGRIHPEDKPKILELITGLIELKTQEYFNCEYRYLKSNGDYAFVIDRGSVMKNDRGEVIRIVGAVQDITDQKDYEASLQKLNNHLENQAVELLRYNEELEQFAYVVSHDLQEPLRMISSFLILLEKKYNHVIEEEGQKYIHFAVDGAKRMRQIILDLLDFSRVGKSEEELIPVDLNVLLEEVSQIFQQETLEKEATIIIPTLPTINSYSLLVQQLFQNLIGNALKYQKEGAKPVVEITYEELASHHKFSVSDNGIGIDSEYFDKIFVIFQRLHGRNQYNGTGIGLALVKKIIENLKGKIWLESEKGTGTTFYFTISKEEN
ncbi:PAS domain-containing protein [Cellulophaga sp. Z1A5H]|uniref:PAS domain-containing protein n=1 Tax=Cellulophaga sp. Z1A5H TaxID=2687291 RepID=UPI0013FD3410|nr:PAS domain-containing protein [Cellulophaga sp. Z1A5H]